MSINAPTKTPSQDLRARRTRKWLQAALLELLHEKPFHDIQITEIADRAEVSRPAFYLHFHSKEELLMSHVDVVFEEFHTAIQQEIKSGEIDRQKFSVMLFEYWERYADTLKLVLAADTHQVVLARLRHYVGIVMDDLAVRRTGRRKTKNALSEATTDFMAGGAYLMLTRWVANDQPLSSAQMGQLLADLSVTCERGNLRQA
jgi:AcrR family transcriptional regulator